MASPETAKAHGLTAFTILKTRKRWGGGGGVGGGWGGQDENIVANCKYLIASFRAGGSRGGRLPASVWEIISQWLV